jgi:hypothetical protein
MEGPFFVTPVFDVNFPRAGAAGGRPDCTARGQQAGRIVYTNSCFRSNAAGNVVVDKRDGEFADDFYLVLSDNRNGTRASSNADVFGTANRDSTTLGDFGNDQWWPWTDISERGALVVTFKDRRLDTDSTAHEWPTSRQRPGNYLVWTWGANCEVRASDATTCMARGAAVIPRPTAPINPGSGPQPGQGPTFLGPLENFGVSDVPSNFDYSFRAGIFAGDYDVVAVQDERAYSHFTDARNGRSSRDQEGRNPACEQSDVFFDSWRASGRASGQDRASESDSVFLVTPCPDDIKDRGRRTRGDG